MSTASCWAGYDLETVVCPLCGPKPGVDVRFYFSPFRVVVCRKCTLMFLSPRLTEPSILKLYQGEEYFQSTVSGQGYDEYLDVVGNWHKTFSYRLGAIQKYKPEGRVLDVGCGPGFFMEVAAKLGYDVWGLDPSSYIVRVAREKFDSHVCKGTLENADFEEKNFDVITAFDTFEHIYGPLEFLDVARELLAPKGILVITTPNCRSLLARVSGRRWVSFKIPEHVLYWSPQNIREVMKGRFEILEISNAGQYTTLSFLARRLFGLGAGLRGLSKALLDALSRISIYADNGSMTVIAART